MKRKLALLALTAAMICVPAIAHSSKIFFNEFKAKYPNAAFLGCVACHNVKAPQGVAPLLNRYGAAWSLRPHLRVAQREAAFNLIEKDDADADGYTNLTEITACTPAIKVLPGFAALPANLPKTAGWRAIPPRLRFFDDFKNAIGQPIPNWGFASAWQGKAGSLVSSALVGERTCGPSYPTMPFALQRFFAGSVSATIQLLDGVDAGIIFSQDIIHRHVSISSTEITIGQVGGAPVIPTVIPFTGFANQAKHTLKVVLAPTGLVSVFVDNVPVGTHQFPEARPGRTGVRANFTRARFDNFTVSR